MRYDEETKARAVDMVRAGMSNQEIAETIGVTPPTISNWAIAAGVKRGRGGGCVAVNNNRRHNAGSRRRTEIAREYLAGRFDVVREVQPHHFTIRCLTCGHEFERYVDTNCQTTCPECTRREVERNEEERRAKSEQKQKRAFMQRLVNILAYEHVCPECGTKFRSSYPYRIYCSARCKAKHKGYSDHETRAKKFGVKFDRSISLGGLIQRDGPECYICGKTCDPNDKRWGSFGPDYPTIDCVVPLKSGGSFTWDNVRVACGECNCVRKGAKDVGELLAG